jgi:hypothetical protein
MHQKQAHIIAVFWAAGKLTVELSSALLCFTLSLTNTHAVLVAIEK